jgi:hypothetical protein
MGRDRSKLGGRGAKMTASLDTSTPCAVSVSMFRWLLLVIEVDPKRWALSGLG